MIIGSNFLSKRIFVLECCCKILGAGLEPESVKEFQSGPGVEKLATPQRFNPKTFQAKATLRL